MTDRKPPATDQAADPNVEKILTEALATPPLADRRLEQLRVTVAREWRDVAAISGRRVRAIRRLRWVGYATAAGIAAILVVFFAAMPTGNPTVIGSIARLGYGDIEVGSWVFAHRTLRVGDALRVGETLAANGPALVSLARGGNLRIAAGSIVAVSGAAQLSLQRGLIYVDLPPADSGRFYPLRVATYAGFVEHIGTEYEISSGAQMVLIRVREGRIRLSTRTQTILADAGTELQARPGGRVTQRPVEAFGRDWLWADALAPDYEIEGHPLIDFLRWVSREMGRPLEFADARARNIAGSTIMHGSVKGQAPMDALTSVLATTSLTYDFDGDALRLHSGT